MSLNLLDQILLNPVGNRYNIRDVATSYTQRPDIVVS